MKTYVMRCDYIDLVGHYAVLFRGQLIGVRAVSFSLVVFIKITNETAIHYTNTHTKNTLTQMNKVRKYLFELHTVKPIYFIPFDINMIWFFFSYFVLI